MFTLLTTWISQRILTVTAVSVLTVAAVPTTLVIVSHDDHNTIAVIQPADEHSKTILVSTVKKAGDDVITKLDAAESSCATQLTQTVNASKVGAKVQPALANAKAKLQASVSPIVAAIRSDEDRFAHLTYVSSQDEENELNDLNLIEVIALGNGQNAGTVTITCQTLTVTITETINITVIQQTPGPCTSKEERDDD